MERKLERRKRKDSFYERFHVNNAVKHIKGEAFDILRIINKLEEISICLERIP